MSNPNGKLPVSRFPGEPRFSGQDSTQYALGYILNHRINDTWSLKQNLRYSHVDVDNKSVFSSGLDPTDPAQRTLLRSAFSAVPQTDAFSVDNHALAEFNTGPLAHRLLLGLDYERIDFDDTQRFGSAPSIDIFDPVYGAQVARPDVFSDSRIRQEQIGVYFQEQLTFRDNWVLTLGGRQDFVDSEQVNRLASTTNTTDDSEFTGQAGLLYKADNGLSPYVSYSRSFSPIVGTNGDGSPFEPSTGEQYEVGAKYQPPGSNLLLTIATYELTRQNVLTPSETNPIIQDQTGEVRSRGVELEAVAEFDSGLNLTAAYTYQDVEITQSNDGNQGNQPLTSPEQFASVYADFTFQDGMAKDLGFGLGARYVGSRVGDNANTFNVDDYTILAGAVHYDWDDIRLGVNVQNLMDKEYVSSCFGTASCVYGRARTVIGSIRYSFY